MKRYIILSYVITLITLTGCKQSNEEKIIKDFLTTTINDDGSTTKTKVGSYTFHSFENIDVDGKFIYSILNPNETVDKTAIENQIKEYMDDYNKDLLYSAIAALRSFDCTPDQWKEEIEYKNNAEKYSNEAISYQSEAYTLGRIYNNFDVPTIHIIKANYDYKLGNMKKEGIVGYFVYDKETNKIIKRFNSLDEEFIAYYYESAEGIEYSKLGIEKYDYGQLLNQRLDSLVSLLD